MRAESTAAPCCLEGPPHSCEHWRQFAAAMVVAQCRWLLTLEARGIATKLLIDDSFSAQLLRDQLLIAIAHAKPRSRLVPWHLNDAAVEKVIGAVVHDVAETWT
jgi:hypothetical protein